MFSVTYSRIIYGRYLRGCNLWFWDFKHFISKKFHTWYLGWNDKGVWCLTYLCFAWSTETCKTSVTSAWYYDMEYIKNKYIFFFLFLLWKNTMGDSQWHLRGYTWLKPITNFKRKEPSRGVCGPIVIIFNNVQIGSPLFILGKIVMKGVNESMIYNLIFFIYLHMKGNKEIKFST